MSQRKYNSGHTMTVLYKEASIEIHNWLQSRKYLVVERGTLHNAESNLFASIQICLELMKSFKQADISLNNILAYNRLPSSHNKTKSHIMMKKWGNNARPSNKVVSELKIKWQTFSQHRDFLQIKYYDE